MKPMNKSRRRFFKQLGAVGAGALTMQGMANGAPVRTQNMFSTNDGKTYSPNDQIQIALIGAGGMGSVDAGKALEVDGVQIVAVCDLYDGRLQKAKDTFGQDIYTTRDYKEILARKDVDAVIIGTPDHWHKQISVDALLAGKSVYCEKPMVHSVDEGPDVIKAQKKSGKVFQVGSQGLSSLGNEKARELLAAGAIGKLNYAEGFWARNSPQGAWQYDIPEDASPETVDWDRYIANTTKRPFDKLRFFRWRNYLDYGTGMSGDLFVHLFSSLHFITGSLGPNKVYASGGLRYWQDGREVPDVLLGIFDYPESSEHPGFNLSLRCNFVDGTSGSTYLKLVGSEGSMDVLWDKVILRENTQSMSDDPFLQAKSDQNEQSKNSRQSMMSPSSSPEIIYSAAGDYKGAHWDHFNNFFTAIRTGKPVVEDAVFGYRACAPALLCNNSYFQDQILHWDPVKMQLK